MAGPASNRQPDSYLDPRAQASIALGLRIDQLCTEFERLWRASDAPRIETFLESVADVDHAAVLRELLAIELEYRADRQETFGSDDYLRRFPHHRPLIELLFAELQQRGTHTSACQPKQTLNEKAATAPSQLEQPAFLLDHPRYRLVKFLGAGGMGSVYLAEHRLMQRVVALKIIRPELLANSSARQRFHHEIKAAARLIHPNIVAAFDAEQVGEHSILAMEYVDGNDLASLVSANGPLSVPDACRFVWQAALGLQHAFEMGMVHRDIKPHNLMLSKSGQVKILDFGLAHFVSETSGATQSGMMLGSIDYMAPEQAADSRTAQIQADIYGLGCTLYSLLTGHPPFPAGSLLDKLRSHADVPPPRVEGIPSGLWPVLARMLAKSSTARFQEPREAALALEPFVAASDRPTANVHVVAVRSGRRIGRPLYSGLAGILLAVGLVGLYWYFAGNHNQALPGAGNFAHSIGASSAVADVSAANPIPIAARTFYHKAQHRLSLREQKPTQDAIDELTQAIAIAPQFAAAHAALANAYNLQGDYGWVFPKDVFPLARASAEKALSLDDSLSDAHLALAFVMHAYDCNLKLAEAEYQRALGLNPESVDAHHWYAWLLVQQDKIDEAEDEIDRAADLGTTSIVLTNRGKVRYFAGAYRAAEKEFRDALERDPDFNHAKLDLGLTYAELNERDKALKEFAELTTTREDKMDLNAAIAYTYARFGESEEARKRLAILELQATEQPLAYEIATIYAALGERGNAFNWLDKAFKQKSAWRTYVKVDPRLQGIRRDPRFQRFIAAAGLDPTSN